MAPLMFMFIDGFFAFLVATTAQGITDSANSVVQDLRMVPVSRLSPKNQAEVTQNAKLCYTMLCDDITEEQGLLRLLDDEENVEV
uniref:Uncharacterized protein n=1 Tax=Timema poppense TaxID=170557 RepID=A0A7R9DW88_TIMPO|nr:unnamed protein product [Timema poppensis]